MYTGGDWLQYFRCASVVSDLRTHKEEKRERPENGSMRVPKMGECFCFLFWADMHYFAAMRFENNLSLFASFGVLGFFDCKLVALKEDM
ncbi:hypothetical protein POTOM_057479 [Populus tomentosa]|uniref:Uncharacterized protein n=1 Tax=Populus tomentosa TaxID=118781 RepID=A0A8X7Y0Y1_POPTO|nr:hypothetical protein POTOM_057479 [Populus tomentosa]